MTIPEDQREGTIFDKIVAGEIPCDTVWEDDQALAFRDINPVAPTHILVIPKRRIVNQAHATEEDRELMGHLMWAVGEVARQEGLEEGGYRVVLNNGAGAGQSVFHMHLHILAGRHLNWPPG